MSETTATMRNKVLIRTWQVLILLRRRPHSLYELAAETGVSTRTIRRDLEALCEVGFPLVCSKDDLNIERGGPAALWSVATIPEWPIRDVMPVAMRPVSGHGHRMRPQVARL